MLSCCRYNGPAPYTLKPQTLYAARYHRRPVVSGRLYQGMRQGLVGSVFPLLPGWSAWWPHWNYPQWWPPGYRNTARLPGGSRFLHSWAFSFWWRFWWTWVAGWSVRPWTRSCWGGPINWVACFLQLAVRMHIQCHPFYAVQLNLVTMQQTGTSVAYPCWHPWHRRSPKGSVPWFRFSKYLRPAGSLFSAVSNKMQH